MTSFGYTPPHLRIPPTLPHGKPWPRVSIVTPSFNQGRFIEESIRSVLDQSYPDVEHIVIDGGSTDGTPAVLERYRDRLAVVVSESDRGQSHAINKGMARATGDILTWLNSDDRLAPGALAAVAMAFHTSGADMVAGVCELWRNGELLDRHLTSCEDGPLPLDDLLDLDGCWNAGQFFFQPEVCFTRDLWARAGGRVDESAHYSMDYELWLRFATAGAQLKVIGRPIARFRLHPEQKTADPSLFKRELPLVRARFLESRGIPLPEPRHRRRPARPARVVFFNDIGFRYGAGIAHGRLADAVALGGHDVSAVSVSRHPRLTPLAADEQRRLLGTIAAAEPDFLIVGNLHGAGVPPAFLAELSNRWPTAFVVHDLWIATGRCAYTKECDKLIAGCDDACPTASEYPALAPPLIGQAWADKRRLLRSPHAPLLLANSEWTRLELDRAIPRAPGDRPSVATITLGIGHEFVPADKADSRRRLGLPGEAFLILLSATSLSDPRKGRDHLLDALAQLRLSDAELVLVGAGEDVEVPGFRVHRLLYQEDPATMALIYSAADLFVGPSLEECLGQVFLEAAACGVPSVGYPVGGVPEALQDGVTGVLAEAVTPVALAEAILRVYGDADLRRWLGVWARLAFENDRSLERTYQRLHSVLRRRLPGADDFFGAKISLRPTATRQASSRVPADLRPPEAWTALSGFGPWEGPYPELRLRRCRWQESLSASFSIKADSPGPHTVLLRCRNLAPHQQLRILCEGRTVFFGGLPVAKARRDTVIRCDVTLDAPGAILTTGASACLTSPEGRSLVLLFCDVEVVPRLEPRQRLAHWIGRAHRGWLRLKALANAGSVAAASSRTISW